MRLTIEKILILKSVQMFANTSEEILAEIATIIEEREVVAGELIIEKGDIGKSMYIIVDGKVKVHDQERNLAELGERDVFGELALLDPEPRSASITALEDTIFFRLEQDAFYELMAEHVEVAKGIIQVLCKKVRAKNEGHVQSM